MAIVYVGIDLGTSRTVCAASNGVRDFVPSFVGYPKDVVARKLDTGTTLRGPALDYLRTVPGRRDTAELVATGRPRASATACSSRPGRACCASAVPA